MRQLDTICLVYGCFLLGSSAKWAKTSAALFLINKNKTETNWDDHYPGHVNTLHIWATEHYPFSDSSECWWAVNSNYSIFMAICVCSMRSSVLSIATLSFKILVLWDYDKILIISVRSSGQTLKDAVSNDPCHMVLFFLKEELKDAEVVADKDDSSSVPRPAKRARTSFTVDQLQVLPTTPCHVCLLTQASSMTFLAGYCYWII